MAKCTIHELARISVKVRGNKKEFRWKCMAPECMAIFKRHQVKDKKSICTVCHKATCFLNNDMLNRARPKCIFCSGLREDVRKREIMDSVESFIADILEPEIKLPDASEIELTPTLTRTKDEQDKSELLSGMYKDE